jgi:uncharacterized membrane protein YoaK (UPF0700 family)
MVNLKNNLYEYLMSNISISRVDIQLIFLSFTVGIIDALMVTELNVFSNNQTGNTIFLGISFSNINSNLVIKWDRNLVSIISFWLAVFIVGQIGHCIGNRKRLWLIFIHIISSLILYIASILLYTNIINISNNQNEMVLIFIMLISFSFGIQAVTVRPLNIPEISTIVVTSAMVDLWSDKNLLKKYNIGRNRRIAFIISLLIGAITGSFLLKISIPGTVILCASIKFVVALSFMFNNKEFLNENIQ